MNDDETMEFQWNRGLNRIVLRVLKIEETGGGKHPKSKNAWRPCDLPMPQGTTRTQPASLSFLFASLPLFLHLLYLFLSSSSLLVSLSAPLRIFFFFLPHFSSLVLFSLYLCPRTHLSLSLRVSRFVPFCGFTSRLDFTNGHTVPFWGNVSHVVPSFPSRKESCFGVSCVSRRHPRSKETR